MTSNQSTTVSDLLFAIEQDLYIIGNCFGLQEAINLDLLPKGNIDPNTLQHQTVDLGTSATGRICSHINTLQATIEQFQSTPKEEY